MGKREKSEHKNKRFSKWIKNLNYQKQHKENQLNLDYSQHDAVVKLEEDESEYETDSDTSSVISQDDPDITSI